MAKKKSGNSRVLKIILIVGLSLIMVALIIFGVTIYLRAKKKTDERKKRLCEIDDDYEYLPENNEKENNNGAIIN